MAWIRVCVVCDQEFLSGTHNAHYCSEECKALAKFKRYENAKAERARAREEKTIVINEEEWVPKYGEPKSMKRLREIARKADKNGMSYGQYMANKR